MFNYKILSTSNIPDMLYLQDIIVKNLEDDNCFRPSTKEMLNLFIKNGYAIGTYKNDKLIAYRLIFMPKESKHNLGLELNLDKEELKKVIHFETTIVHPDFRGHRLQLLLTNELLKTVDTKNKIICSSCFPLNYPSLSNLLKMGLYINAIKYIYDSKLRFILSNQKFTPKNKEYISCSCEDTQKMKKLLDNNYFGVKLKSNKNSKKFDILFQKVTLL